MDRTPVNIARAVAEGDKEAIARARLLERLKGLSDVDIIKLWYESNEEFELSERQDHIRQRWEMAKALFLKRRRYVDIRDKLMAHFGISERQATRAIKDALDCFGELDRVPREAHRARAIQMALSAYKRAKNNGDPDAMTNATRMYYRAAGLEDAAPDRMDMEKLMATRTYVEILDPVIRELLLNFLEQSGGSLDASKIFELIYAARSGEYVPYEQILDDAGDDPAGD